MLVLSELGKLEYPDKTLEEGEFSHHYGNPANCKSINKSINQSINQSANQPTDLPMNQSISKPINQ